MRVCGCARSQRAARAGGACGRRRSRARQAAPRRRPKPGGGRPLRVDAGQCPTAHVHVRPPPPAPLPTGPPPAPLRPPPPDGPDPPAAAAAAAPRSAGRRPTQVVRRRRGGPKLCTKGNPGGAANALTRQLGADIVDYTFKVGHGPTRGPDAPLPQGAQPRGVRTLACVHRHARVGVPPLPPRCRTTPDALTNDQRLVPAALHHQL